MKIKKEYIFNRFTLLAVLFILYIILAAGFKLYKRGHRIQWQDHALEMEVKRNMGHDGDIWTGDIKDWFDTMEIIGEDVHSLEDLRQFPNIKTLYLRDTSVTDLSPLESMTTLYNLFIDGGKIKDLEPLSNIKSLQEVRLYNLPVTSVQPLSELDNLSVISLSGLNVEALPSWKGHRLKILYLKNLPLKSIEELRDFKSLEIIKIENTEIEDVNALYSLSGLQDIILKGKSIKSIPDLSHFAQLDSLTVYDTSVDQLPKLPKNLRKLCLNGNLISDLNLEEPLNSLGRLELSNIPQDCDLEDFNILEFCPYVSKLYLSGDHLQSLDRIARPDALIELDLSDNQLINIDEIEKQSGLRTLDLSNNPISDLSGLEQLPLLQELDLSGINLSNTQTQKILSELNLKFLKASSCELNNMDFLNNSPDIEKLYLSHNNIQNLVHVTVLDHLSTLDISYNPIKDLEPLRKKRKFALDFTLDVSGIDMKTMNLMRGENELRIKGVDTMIASNCNLDKLDFIQSSMNNIDVSNNHIEDLSLLKKIPNNIKRLDISGNYITENNVKDQLEVKEIYPGLYFGPSEGDPPYWQIKVDKDKEFLMDRKLFGLQFEDVPSS